MREMDALSFHQKGGMPAKTNLTALAARVFSSSIISFEQFFYLVDLSVEI